MKNTAKCVLCGTIINSDNDSKEHIIPNAIGGRKKLSGFICESCNSTTGEQWDAELAKQLLPLCHLFPIKRDRGKTPSIKVETTSGLGLELNSSGSTTLAKPEYSEQRDGNYVNVSIKARTSKEAKILAAQARAHDPLLDLDEFLSKSETKCDYDTGMIKFSIVLGGQSAGRSIVKSALAVCASVDIHASICEEAIDYLTNEDADCCFGYYYERDLLRNRPENMPVHCIYIDANPDTKLVSAYIELFGIYRMVAFLSQDYKGERLNGQYSIDPITGDELNLDVDLMFDSSDIHDIYSYKRIPRNALNDIASSLIPIGMKLNYENEKDRLITKALYDGLRKAGCSEGAPINPEHLEALLSELADTIVPFLIHNMNRRV